LANITANHIYSIRQASNALFSLETSHEDSKYSVSKRSNRLERMAEEFLYRVQARRKRARSYCYLLWFLMLFITFLSTQFLKEVRIMAFFPTIQTLPHMFVSGQPQSVHCRQINQNEGRKHSTQRSRPTTSSHPAPATRQDARPNPAPPYPAPTPPAALPCPTLRPGRQPQR
jgi:hypothetical protein